MTKLTKEQLDELRRIASNDASLGAFTGMIFNNLQGVRNPPVIEDEIQAALEVRVIARRMAR
jgi:hypothetical protein